MAAARHAEISYRPKGAHTATSITNQRPKSPKDVAHISPAAAAFVSGDSRPPPCYCLNIRHAGVALDAFVTVNR